ncbi:MAG: RNA degradosome polyphosphate kinase [Rickettsiales bacterium]|nr:RNA degradosome polyphosphate kinase [Rickettsiales bacterium]
MTSLKPRDRYFNRELSWIAFNARVLEEANNIKNPLLERLKFLSISASNLDEFYMVRVAGLVDRLKSDDTRTSIDGRSPEQQLKEIYADSNALIHEQEACWQKIRQLLAEEDIHIVEEDELSEQEVVWLERYFHENIFPALTPIALDPSHPFPFLPNLGIAVVLELKKKEKIAPLRKTSSKARSRSKETFLKVVLPLPLKLDRFIRLPGEDDNQYRFILLEDAVRLFQHQLFPDSEINGAGMIRITRSSELDLMEQPDNLISVIDSALKQRRRAEVVRLRVSSNMPKHLLQFLTTEFELREHQIVQHKGIFAMANTAMLYAAIDRPELKYPPINIRFPERINDYDGDCFAAIEAKDIIVHHPYESFDVVAQFIRQAAKDPDVIAIKQTLYRTSNDSPIVKALIEAAESGKSVTVVVELKARFDEEANLRWGRNLERAGAQVIYGLVGLKTHAKVSLVIRRAENGLKSYVHYGTGNYHPITAKVYSDLSFFTCDTALCRDAGLLFNYMTGYSPPPSYEKISVAPLTLRRTILRLIREEIAHAEAGRPAAIWMKMNALVDKDIIDALYAASQKNVSIDLVIRGVCCLKPGIPGLSETIRVKSIVGRFLEHARIYCFGTGHGLPSTESKVFISSADMMTRNLDSRVEVLVPIENPTVHAQVLDQIMVSNIKDNTNSWTLDHNGVYTRSSDAHEPFSAHNYFIHNPSLSGRGTARSADRHRKRRKKN